MNKEINQTTKIMAMNITKEIVVSSLQSVDKMPLIYNENAEQLQKSIEIIFNKVLELIKQ